MITSLILLFVILAGPVIYGATAEGSPSENFYASLINTFYGTNHTGRPLECGRDWTYYHYLVTQMLIQILLTVLHIILTITFFVKLWKRNGKTLKI